MSGSGTFADEGLRLFRNAMRRLPGVVADSAMLTGGRTLRVDGSGWSPTLHRIDMRWEFDVASLAVREGVPDAARRLERLDPSLLRDLLKADHLHGSGRTPFCLFEMAAIAIRQEMRVERARRHGIDAPLRHHGIAEDGSTHGAVGPTLVDRMTVELTMRSEDHPSRISAGERLVNQMAMLQALRHLDNGNDIRHPMARSTGLEENGRECWLRVAHLVQPGVEDVFDGRVLVHFGIMPETLLAGLTGRPLGTLMATGTDLDRRIVTDTLTLEDQTRMFLEGDDIRLDSLI